MSKGWVGACDVAGEATAAVLTDMASWGPANAMAAHANRTIPDRRIRMCGPPPVPLIGGGIPQFQAGQGSPATRTLPLQRPRRRGIRRVRADNDVMAAWRDLE